MRDLGTGLLHRSIIPCVAVNINALPAIGKITCKLYLGTWPNPTQIYVNDFDTILSGTSAELHFPHIFNPNATHELVEITLRVE